MTRFGFDPAEALALLDEPDAFAGLTLTLVMSHLACADTPEHPANAAQLAAFSAVRARLPLVPASLAASSGIVLGPDFHFDWSAPAPPSTGSRPSRAGTTRCGRSSPCARG